MSDEPSASSPAGTEGEQEHGESPVAPRRPSKTQLVTLGTAVVVAVFGAAASAVITPDRIDEWFGGGSAGTVSQPTESAPIPVQMKTVTSAESALTVQVPTEWISLPARYDVRYENVEDAGTALNAGTDIRSGAVYTESWLYLAASKRAAERMSLNGADMASLRGAAKSALGDLDWTLDGCVLSAEPQHARPGWVVESRLWRECGTLSGVRLWEVVAAPDDGSVLVQLQLVLQADVPDEVFERILASVAVAAEKLPGARAGDSVIP